VSWVFTEEDFHGEAYSEYRRYGFFADRGIEFNNQWNGFKNNTLLIAGCGYGFLVQELMEEHGFNSVWGVDASQYAINNAPAGYEDRMLLGDITVDQDIRDVANQAGLSGGNPRFRAILTEDILPCMDNEAEVEQALSVLRDRSQAMAHIISPKLDNTWQHPDMLWLTQQEWLDLIGPGEPILFTNNTEVSNV